MSCVAFMSHASVFPLSPSPIRFLTKHVLIVSSIYLNLGCGCIDFQMQCLTAHCGGHCSSGVFHLSPRPKHLRLAAPIVSPNYGFIDSQMLCFPARCCPSLSQKAYSCLGESIEYIGRVKVHVIKATDLVIKDFTMSSDPYVMIRFGDQTVKSFTIKRNLNPSWNDELTIDVPSINPLPRLQVEVMDKNTFSSDESLGTAEVDISHFVEIAKGYESSMKDDEGKIKETQRIDIRKFTPAKSNEFSSDSNIYMENGQIKQNLNLNLKNVESGQVDIELTWIYL